MRIVSHIQSLLFPSVGMQWEYPETSLNPSLLSVIPLQHAYTYILLWNFFPTSIGTGYDYQTAFLFDMDLNKEIQKLCFYICEQFFGISDPT